MTTRTVVWALTWEYWRRGTIWLVPAVAGLVIACTGLLYGPTPVCHSASATPISGRNSMWDSWRSSFCHPWS